jgi:hypothetical protein
MTKRGLSGNSTRTENHICLKCFLGFSKDSSH